jgi:DNA-binding response OmpR family regulator
MADAPSVVLVEDDVHISDLVSLYLDQSGFRVYRADNGADGLRVVAEREPRLVILDVGLPGDIDGLEVCRRLRTTTNVPVIMLTARDGEIDRVLGLELGADDYVTKPFSPRELVARVKAILRRSDGAAPAQAQSNGAPRVLTTGEVEVDTGRAEARVDGDVIPLTTREFALLLYLAENKGLALSRRQLLDGAWGADWYGDERTVDVHVRQLRKKMGDALPLATVRGIGYRLE